MVLDSVSDLLSSKPSKVVPALAAATKGVGISVFSLGFSLQCSVPIRSDLGGRALHGCLNLDPSLFDKLRIRVFWQFSEWRMFFTPSVIVKAPVSDLLFSTPSTMVPAPAAADMRERISYAPFIFWSMQRLALVWRTAGMLSVGLRCTCYGLFMIPLLEVVRLEVQFN